MGADVEQALVFALWFVFSLSDHRTDPVQQAWLGRSHLRELECERLSQAEAHRRYPDVVPQTDMRSQVLMQIDALICERRIVPIGVRAARDEVILTHLSDEIDSIANLAQGVIAPETTLLVDAWYPQPEVQGRIRSSLLQRLGDSDRVVSARLPSLAATDIEVMNALPLQDALPLACRQLHREGGLKDSEALVGVAVLREDETQLHAGVCTQGAWRWLQ